MDGCATSDQPICMIAAWALSSAVSMGAAISSGTLPRTLRPLEASPEPLPFPPTADAGWWRTSGTAPRRIHLLPARDMRGTTTFEF